MLPNQVAAITGHRNIIKCGFILVAAWLVHFQPAVITCSLYTVFPNWAKWDVFFLFCSAKLSDGISKVQMDRNVTFSKGLSSKSLCFHPIHFFLCLFYVSETNITSMRDSSNSLHSVLLKCSPWLHILFSSMTKYCI